MSLNDKRLGEARIIAFATHALIGGELEGLKEPALVLTPPQTATQDDNGLLSIDDILKLKLTHTDWVILSACNTAAGDGSGEGLSGLARAFFYAGAPSLLVSQWSVDDSATQNLMAGVLSGYAADPKLTRARALQLGMLRLMQQQARGDHLYFAHPFSWAPFFIVGEGGSPKGQRGRLASADPSRLPAAGMK
jgi:CHAT domain-containing protein